MMKVGVCVEWSSAYNSEHTFKGRIVRLARDVLGGDIAYIDDHSKMSYRRVPLAKLRIIRGMNVTRGPQALA